MSQKQTAKKAIEILCHDNAGFLQLEASEKVKLATAFARGRRILYLNAFDIVKCQKKVDFANEDDIARNLESITVYEVKSTDRKNISKGFKGYFFDLTTAELLVAQSLGKQYRFAFVDTTKGEYEEWTLQQVFARARGIYPKWAIRF